MNEKGEKKPGKNGITLELEEFDAMVRLILQIQESIARYELQDTGISSSPFELDLPVLDLDMVFLSSPPSENPVNIRLHGRLRELHWIKELGTAAPFGCNDQIKGVGTLSP